MVAYPPEPWKLRGTMVGSLWLVPRSALATNAATAAVLPLAVTARGRALVVTAWVHYEPGGVLTYREVMAAVLVRHGRRLCPTVTHIWVDSSVSRDGGRTLWGIPKELAVFTVTPEAAMLASRVRVEARDSAGPIVATVVDRGRRLPGRWPVRFRVVQNLDGEPRMSPVRLSGTLALHRSQWHPAPPGPLGFLGGRRPWITLGLRDFSMTFGSASEPDGSRRPTRRRAAAWLPGRRRRGHRASVGRW
jgi:hypothetical protein